MIANFSVLNNTTCLSSWCYFWEHYYKIKVRVQSH